jgi:uncharacterized protein
MKTLIIYHKNCSDGFGAAFSAWNKLKDSVNYLPLNHEDETPWEIYQYEKIYFLDFVLQEQEIIKLLNKGIKIEVIDHHKTAYEYLQKINHSNLMVTYDPNKAGTELAWEHWNKECPIPSILKDISDRDLGKSSYNSDKVVSALMTYPREFLVWQDILFKDREYLVAEGEAIIRLRTEIIAEMIERIHFALIDDQWIPVVNATVWWNDLTKELIKKFPKAPFVGAYCQISDKKIKWSLRSNGEIDVGFVARKYSGGGHKTNSGFISLPQEIKLSSVIMGINKKAS